MQDYFCGRNVVFVGGAGFDPRACEVAKRLKNAGALISALLIKEVRPNASDQQVKLADSNCETLRVLFGEQPIFNIDIFGADGAVIGGRNVVNALRQHPIDSAADVIVDISALSVGTSFPVIRYFHDLSSGVEVHPNLHVFATHDPSIDIFIHSISSDLPGYLHGFKGNSTLSQFADAACMWLPQLSIGRRQALERLFDFVKPNDTCPILPFPSHEPRLGDELAEEYMSELENTWSVDTRNIVYADEGDPLDLYRTILRLGDFRHQVFGESGGSLLVLSPLGSKVLALGMLMASLERNYPIAHVESISYTIPDVVLDYTNRPDVIHIWLQGDAYPT